MSPDRTAPTTLRPAAPPRAAASDAPAADGFAALLGAADQAPRAGRHGGEARRPSVHEEREPRTQDDAARVRADRKAGRGAATDEAGRADRRTARSGAPDDTARADRKAARSAAPDDTARADRKAARSAAPDAAETAAVVGGAAPVAAGPALVPAPDAAPAVAPPGAGSPVPPLALVPPVLAPATAPAAPAAAQPAPAGAVAEAPQPAGAPLPGAPVPPAPAPTGTAPATPAAPAAPVAAAPAAPGAPVAPGLDAVAADAAQPEPAGATQTPVAEQPAPAAPEAPAAAGAPADPAAAPPQDAGSGDAPQGGAGRQPAAEAKAETPAPAAAPASGSAATAAAPPAAQPAVAPRATAALHQAPRAVAQLLHVAVDRGITHAKLNLRPVELGGIEIRLQSSAAGVTAQVIADSPAAAKLLEQAASDLRRSLERQDVTLLSLDVSTAGDDRPAGSSGASSDLFPGETARHHGLSGRGDDAESPDEQPVVATTVQLPDGLLVDVLA